MKTIVCRPRALTPTQAETARRRSIEVNPANAAEQLTVVRTPVGRRGGPRRLALVIGRRWPKAGVELSVQFLDNPSRPLRSRILLHMNAWSKTANVRFVETAGTGQVRIARLDRPKEMAGYWSYVGTEILGIEDDQPTFNLDSFTMRTSEAEFKRVVRHEAGHTLGFDHEHLRADLIRKIDRRKAIAYYDEEEGWTEAETIEQVLTPLAKSSIMGTTESDPHSIMCYEIPAEITKDGAPIVGGTDITAKDFEFAAKIYPIPQRATAGPAAGELATAPLTEPLPALFATAGRTLADPASDTFHVVVMDRFDPDGTQSGDARAAPGVARVFATYGGARVTIPMRLRAVAGGPRTRWPAIISTQERIKDYTDRQTGALPSEAEMMRFGADLFETLFQGDVRRLYDEARSRQHGRKLDFVFTSMVPWIAEKPWEFAYDASRRSFLATEDVHFVRNVLTAIPADVVAPRAGPMHILVASAQPVGFGRLSIEQEEEVIRRGFQPLVDAGLAKVHVLARATPSSIHAQLSTGAYTVVHFIGHGVFDERTEEGFLIFQDANGGQYPVGERSIREIFCQRGVTLVFLNACQTGAGGRADFNKGVAQALVSHGLPALVANQYSVLDSSATHYAQQFYWALGQGMSVGQAAREARIAVNYSLQGETIDWAVPAVYARDPNLRICDRPDDTTLRRAVTAPPARRRTSSARPVEIGVWDIDNVFPALKTTLQAMNAVQARFGFDLVDLSAPVDTWDMEEKAEDGTPYLWSEKLARRLARAPLDHGLTALVCITRHWLRSDEYLNIYAWWPGPDEPPVLIFSVAGFDDLPPEGPETDRAFVNVLVAALAGYLAEMDTHERGARDCPMWFNDSRSLEYMTAPQKFDRGCRAKLLAKIPRDLAALEALLKTFA